MPGFTESFPGDNIPPQIMETTISMIGEDYSFWFSYSPSISHGFSRKQPYNIGNANRIKEDCRIYSNIHGNEIRGVDGEFLHEHRPVNRWKMSFQ